MDKVYHFETMSKKTKELTRHLRENFELVDSDITLPDGNLTRGIRRKGKSKLKPPFHSNGYCYLSILVDGKRKYIPYQVAVDILNTTGTSCVEFNVVDDTVHVYFNGKAAFTEKLPDNTTSAEIVTNLRLAVTEAIQQTLTN